MTTSLIILAAGQGTRMQSDLPKVMHELGGAPLFAHALRAGRVLDPERVVLVVGHGADLVARAARGFESEVLIVHQEEQLGTAHAVAQAGPALDGVDGDAIVLYGDTPFISEATLSSIQKAREAGADVVVLGFEAADPGRYGRLVVAGGRLERIVEYKDATNEERSINLCNSGVVCADKALLLDLVSQVKPDNDAREYYLTDIVAIANARALTCSVVLCDEAETLGINTRAELARAESALQARARAQALEDGVTLVAPESVTFAYDTVIGRDAVVEPNVVFAPGVSVESGARIRAFSHLEGCHVSSGAIVGPFARLRPGAELGPQVHVGNFVEIKNAEVSQGAKVNHLTYIGDAFIGEATNIGAGTITCNYDGFSKHHTHIGARSFIGSDTMLVAPVRVGDEAMTATGTVVTSDVADGAMAIGRAKLEIKPGLARRMFEKLKSAKARRQKGR